MAADVSPLGAWHGLGLGKLYVFSGRGLSSLEDGWPPCKAPCQLDEKEVSWREELDKLPFKCAWAGGGQAAGGLFALWSFIASVGMQTRLRDSLRHPPRVSIVLQPARCPSGAAVKLNSLHVRESLL